MRKSEITNARILLPSSLSYKWRELSLNKERKYKKNV